MQTCNKRVKLSIKKGRYVCPNCNCITNQKASSETVSYTHLDVYKRQVNKLHGLLLKVRGRGDTELAGKLQKALLALADVTRRCAEE